MFINNISTNLFQYNLRCSADTVCKTNASMWTLITR